MPGITLAIEDRLLRCLKEKATREGQTLQEVANELLGQSFEMRLHRSEYRLELEGWDASELPDTNVLNRAKLLDILGKS